MKTRVAINGFGRIGRQVLRAIIEKYPDSLDVIAVNDLGDPGTNAHMFKYDSNYGIYPGEIDFQENQIKIDEKEIQVVQERDPSSIKWDSLGIEIVIESTGFFTNAEKAAGHLEGGAKKVIISAPANGEDATIVMGVNEEIYDEDKHNIISNASCTTNCVANTVKVIDDYFGVEKALMTTIHSYTNDQKILDQVHSDLRRSRAAAINIIPTTTGAAKAVGLVLPHLNGKIHGMAFRVPTPTGSVTDLVATLNQNVTVEQINEAYKEVSNKRLNGIIEYTDKPLVSTDFIRNPNSVILDGLSTIVMDGNMVKVVGWYDNEWGYSCRTADLCKFISNNSNN